MRELAGRLETGRLSNVITAGLAGGEARQGDAVRESTAALHEHLHAHHMHIGREAPHRAVAPFVIWVLVFLHVAFVGALLLAWYRQKIGKVATGAAKREAVPQKVNCVYEFAVPNMRTTPEFKAKG